MGQDTGRFGAGDESKSCGIDRSGCSRLGAIPGSLGLPECDCMYWLCLCSVYGMEERFCSACVYLLVRDLN